MAFPPQFLDDLRARIGLSDLIARRVRLTRRGREAVGLCPFHNEKSPSFTVVEDKGFYHCFGCGAHGDAIAFVMRTESLSFPEAVEKLAHEAGVAMPVASPEERARAKAVANHHEIAEAAARWFETQLRKPESRVALDYFRRRGLDDEAMDRFRLGYAPDGRSALKSALLAQGISEPLLIEAGLIIQPEDGGASYDRFRGRVIFPITDRRGRAIAFGGRILGDGQPKYLNSPDTPLFNKGRTLYGWAIARKAAADTGRVIVVEGYMDVIALARAGFSESVAPLGTALTETQIEDIWRLAPEPILCFDGDQAGQRAANRAMDRALPLLKPGHSLRFVVLPPGEDPDSLLAKEGGRAMAELLDRTRSLNEMLWEAETSGRRFDTPERIAALEQRLEDRAAAIPDRKVQFQYRAWFRQSLRAMTFGDGAGFKQQQRRTGTRAASSRRRLEKRHPQAHEVGLATRLPIEPGPHKRETALIAHILNHPALLDEFAECLGGIRLLDAKLDKLREGILMLYTRSSAIDAGELQRHLREQGHVELVDLLLGIKLDKVSHRSVSPDVPMEMARIGFKQILFGLIESGRNDEIDEASKAWAAEPTPENWSRYTKLIVEHSHGEERREAELADLDMVATGRVASTANT